MCTLSICCIAALVCSSLARPNQYDGAAKTRSYSSDIGSDGSYQYQFDTTNGITAQESGIGGQYISGSSSHYAPDGQLITLTYIADKNGFHPSGDHLPTLPLAVNTGFKYRSYPNQGNKQDWTYSEIIKLK